MENTATPESAYLPNTVVAASEKESPLALLKDRLVKDSTMIYICQHGSCKLPVTQIKEALHVLQKKVE